MKPLDLVDLKLPLRVGDRDFVVHRLRLADLLRLLNRFDGLVRKLSEEKPAEPLQLLSSLTADDTADLLAFFLDPYDWRYLRENLSFEKRAEVLVHLRALHDFERIWRSLAISRVAAPPSGEIEPVSPASRPIPAILRCVDRLAQRYGQSPPSILEWTYEGFLTVVELVEADAEFQRGEALRAGVGLPEGFDLDNLDDSEIPVSAMPDLNKVN